MCSTFNTQTNILGYEQQVWNACDVIRGPIQTSQIPSVMMPFFALIMMESRLVREYTKFEKQFLSDMGATSLTSLSDDEKEDLKKDVIDSIIDEGRGYNSVVIEDSRRLRDVCMSSTNFQTDFDDYLDAYDEETRLLLGIDSDADENFLNIRGHIKSLNAKNKLFEFVKAWSLIDLSTFTNSQITTLEEHIKRKWADMSAATSGEHYTPSDIIETISDLITSYVDMGAKFDHDIELYDMASGGGNLIYGVEDALKIHPSIIEKGHTFSTYGQEINDQLYALAKIESRFRTSSTMTYGDTLAHDRLAGRNMDFCIANAPYGLDWKSVEKEVKGDESGRFPFYPAMSDGQFLFMTHAVHKLKDHGKAILVANGSPMFSGDVNSGESQIRKWLLDNDYVEAWIQLPKDEFFNTGITTYLWVINKDKPADRKDKVILINAAERFKKLKKSMGKKTNEMTKEDREWVVGAFTSFVSNSDDVKVMSKYDFYYNKQQLTLLPENADGKFYDHLPEKTAKDGTVSKVDKIPLKEVSEVKVFFDDVAANRPRPVIFEINDGLLTKAYWQENPSEVIYQDGDGESGLDAVKDFLKPLLSGTINVIAGKDLWQQRDTDLAKNREELGAGSLDVKVSWQKSSKAKDAGVKVTVDAKPIMEKDYEIIPYYPIAGENETSIQGFLDKWVRKQYILGTNNVGVEVNFNKVFYKPVVLRSTKEIAADIKALDNELMSLEGELWE